MIRRGQWTSYQERLEINEGAEAERSAAQIAEALGCSIWTVRKWRQNYRREGKAGLVSQMGRPATGALGTYPAEVRERVERIRLDQPGWGAATILDQLVQDDPAAASRLPSRARVAAFLKERGLTRRYEKHGGVAHPPLQKPTKAHEEWQMDAQGAQPVADMGKISIINIADVVSRLKVESYPHPGTKSSWEDYQLALRCAFAERGLPERVSLDHDSVFFDNTSQSPFPSRLHLWLVALNVEVIFLRKCRPTDHAIVERMHQTMTAQGITGQKWASPTALYKGLDQRREALNTRLPCRSLGQQAPLAAHPEACHSQRSYRVEWEEELLDLHRVYRLLATGRWFRQTNCHGEFWLGMQRYNAGRTCAKCTLEITFDPTTLEFVAQKAGADSVIRFKALGITKPSLMGEQTMLFLPSYQLALPFSRQAWREMELASDMTG